MIHAHGWLDGAASCRIFWRSWRGETPAERVVVIVHGAGEHSGRYEHVAARLVSAGAAVYAGDHRGHGRSDGPRALIRNLDDAVADVHGVVEVARRANPALEVFMLGHSMGALIALRYVMAHPDALSGLVLTGALAAAAPTPPAVRALGRRIAAIAPRTPLFAIDPETVSRHAQVVADYRADALVHHRPLPAGTVVELADALEALPESVWAVTLPTLILYGTADALCPPEGSVMLGERIGSPDTTIKAYDGLFHEILNEPERDAVLDDVCDWLTAHAVASPLAPAGPIRR